MEIRTFIKEKLSLVLEAKVEDHFLERLKSRILFTDMLNVGYEIDGTVGRYRIVGSYQIPQDIKQKALDTYNKIVMTNFPKNQSFGIQIAHIPINLGLVNLHSGIDQAELKGKTLILVDDATNSNGNIIYAIIRNNEAMTIYFGKSYVPQTPEKMKVDYLIKNIDNYTPRR